MELVSEIERSRMLEDKRGSKVTNMNSTLNLSSADELLALEEVSSTTSEITIPEKSVTSERKSVASRPSYWRASDILEGVVGVLAVLYLLGIVALGLALLFYTFNR